MNAAGILFRTPDNLVLFLQRSDQCDHPGQWAFPGGGAAAGETGVQTAKREAAEETGYDGAGEPKFLCSTNLEGVEYATYVQPLSEQFTPRLNGEHVAFVWAPVNEPPENLHPGVALVLLNLELEKPILAFDRSSSVRSIDTNGILHVLLTRISKANVCPYFGKEIPDSEKLGLDDNKVYYLFRDPQELAKAADTFNNLPLLKEHTPFSVQKPPTALVIGSTGTDAVFQSPFLMNSLSVWDATAIAGIESEDQKELSCAYRYRADMTPGTFQGVRYDGVMRDIRGNHVAIVVDGRAGDDVIVGDSSLVEKPMSKRNKGSLSLQATLAKGALAAFLMPKLAQDAKLDLNPLVATLTKANWQEKKNGLVVAVQAAVKGKLAKDASIDGLIELLDKLQGTQMPNDEPDMDLDAAPGGPAGGMGDMPDPDMPDPDMPNPDDPAADPAALGGAAPADPSDTLGKVLEFLQGKLSDEDMAQIEALMDTDEGAVTPDADPALETPPADIQVPPVAGAGDPNAGPPPTPGTPPLPASNVQPNPKEDQPMDKKAMDAAIKAAETRTEANTIKRMRAISDAEAIVRPFLGETTRIACDSADEVYKLALEACNVNIEGVHPSAYKAMVGMLTVDNPETAVRSRPVMAADAASIAGFKNQFPTAGAVRQL